MVIIEVFAEIWGLVLITMSNVTKLKKTAKKFDLIVLKQPVVQ
jgi:hypothetical protein